jgi:hypothetical protein
MSVGIIIGYIFGGLIAASLIVLVALFSSYYHKYNEQAIVTTNVPKKIKSPVSLKTRQVKRPKHIKHIKKEHIIQPESEDDEDVDNDDYENDIENESDDDDVENESDNDDNNESDNDDEDSEDEQIDKTSKKSPKIIRTPSKIDSLRTVPLDAIKSMAKLYIVTDEKRIRLLNNIYQPIVDLCAYHEGLLVLLSLGNMVYLCNENGQIIEYQLPSKEDIVSITPFQDGVIGLSSSGKLYKLLFENENNYTWIQILSSVNKASYISSPEDGDILFVRNGEKGITYDSTLDIIETFDGNKIKIYGTTVDEIVYIDRASLVGKYENNNTIIKNVFDGCFHRGVFVPVSYVQFEKGISKIKSIDSELYYIINV